MNDEALFDEVRDKRDRAAGVITLPDYQYPMLVTFEDITDPASVRLVDPADLAASFGPGVRLKSVVLEVTDEPVTEGRVEDLVSSAGGPFRNRHSALRPAELQTYQSIAA